MSIREEKKKIREDKMRLLEKEANLNRTEAQFYKQKAGRLQLQQPILQPDQLVSLLVVHPTMGVQDLDNMASQGKTGPSASYARSYWLLRNRRFQAWLQSVDTGGFLVSENGLSQQRISSTSFTCVTLIQGLMDSPEAVIICFFCSVHSRGRTSAEGPQGLMRSLISQLLATQTFDLGFIDQNSVEKLQNFDLSYLCHMFSMLVEQLPQETTLFCIIDSIAVFQAPKYGEGISLIMDMFSNLITTLKLCSRAPIFKLFMTTSKSVKSVSKYFPSVSSISVPAVAGDGRDVSGTYLVKHARKTLGSPNKDPQQVIQQQRPEAGRIDEHLGSLLEITSDSSEESP